LIFSGSETLAAITPTRLVTTENAVSRFSPEERGCYEEKEFSFAYLKWSDGYRYSIKNCLYEAVIDRIVNNCSCFPSFGAPRKTQGFKVMNLNLFLKEDKLLILKIYFRFVLGKTLNVLSLGLNCWAIHQIQK